MARSRRALLRKGNVTDIAEARKKREEKQKAREQALANARIGTLDEASRHADAIQAAIAAEASESQALCASASGAAVNQVSGHISVTSAMTGSGSVTTAGTGAGGTSAGSAVTSSANPTMAAANGYQPMESAPPAQPVQQAPAASVKPEAATQPAARRECEQGSNDAAGKKARAAKKNANRTFNREKVEAIKKAIANGTYQINATRTADKFIERESYS